VSDDELARLREELDELDRRILSAAARRTEVVRRVAAAKMEAGGGQRPLFDRTRERAVYDRARAVAEEIGLDPKLGHRLMQTLVEASHVIQEEVSRRTSVAEAAAHPRRFVIVGGDGRMGCLLRRELAARGHGVEVLERDDGRDRAAVAGAGEIVVIAVPMEDAARVAAEIGPHVDPGALLCDINSLKAEVCAAMESSCRGEVIGLHPMFGPTVHSLRRQKVVVCPVRPGPLAAWLREELGAIGAELIETDPVAHDRMMAVVQVLVHFSTLVMGEALRSTGVGVDESLRFTSPIYRLELAFVGRLFAQNPDLYAEIEMTNPHGAEVRRRFRDAAEALDRAIAASDRDAFRAVFDGVSRYFKEFAGEAMTLSDFVIDSVVMQP
jgi:chorismate mutase/prephenate dehydrogenase